MLPTFEGRKEEGEPGPDIGIAVKLMATPGEMRTPPVTFGENTAAVLAELGYDAATIDELSSQGVI